MVGLLRSEGQFQAAAASSVQPSVIRSAEIGTLSQNGTDSWVDSGTFDASQSGQSNVVLVILIEIFSVTGDTATWTVNQLDIGGSAATEAAGFIQPTDGWARSASVASFYRLSPSDNATLSVEWDISASSDELDAGKVYGVLLQDVDQSTPFPTIEQTNNNNTNDAFQDTAITTQHDLSLLLGGFIARGADTAPHTARNSSTILQQDATNGSSTFDAGASIATKDPGGAGAKTLGVNFDTADGRGSIAMEVKAA